ncbi:MAG: hypothetical protein WDZ52_15105 [Pseudohongiellaceae bacterium]
MWIIATLKYCRCAPVSADSISAFEWHSLATDGVEQLHDLLHVISQRVARFLEKRGILERDEGNSYLTLDGLEEDPLQDIHSH